MIEMLPCLELSRSIKVNVLMTVLKKPSPIYLNDTVYVRTEGETTIEALRALSKHPELHAE